LSGESAREMMTDRSRTGERQTPQSEWRVQARLPDWEPIRGFHQAQRLNQSAAFTSRSHDRTRPVLCVKRKNSLASPRPSTHSLAMTGSAWVPVREIWYKRRETHSWRAPAADRAVVEEQRMGSLPIASFAVRKRHGIRAAAHRAVPRDSALASFRLLLPEPYRRAGRIDDDGEGARSHHLRDVLADRRA
jgi:hypothetical protein